MKPVAPQIGPDPKIARKIFACLDEVFDDSKRLYRDGETDDAVAKKLGVSLEIVTNIRRTAYGELAENPAISKLGEDVAMLRLEMEDAIETTRKTFLDKFNHLDAELAKLKRPGAVKAAS